MAIFKGETQEWDFRINFGVAQGLKREGIVNLLSGETEDLNKLQFNLETRGQVYEFLCREQIKVAGMTEEQFAAEFGKGKLKEAQEVLISQVVDFFHEAGMGEIAEYARKLTTEFVEARKQLGEKVKGFDLGKALKSKLDEINLEEEVQKQTGSK